jgi:hypothetical protein
VARLMELMRKSNTGWWMLGAFVPSMLIGWMTLRVAGTSAPGTVLALQLTARWAYLFFWPTYAGSALVAIFGRRFALIARRGRELGLAFAAAMLPHVALVAWIFYESPTPPMSRAKAVYFSVALVFAYLLALLSIKRVGAKLSPTLNHKIRLIGVEYIALAFLRDFLGVPTHATAMQWMAYLPFIALAVMAGLLRLTRAFLNRSTASYISEGDQAGSLHVSCSEQPNNSLIFGYGQRTFKIMRRRELPRDSDNKTEVPRG